MKTPKLAELIGISHSPEKSEAALRFHNLINQVDSTELHLVMHRHHPINHEIILKSNVEQVSCYADYHKTKSNNDIHLSPREQAIAQLVAEGLPNKVIAHQLQISQWTVATHLRRLFLKIGVSSRTAMIAKLLSQDLL
ncbi:response regulator transcription factor [Gloeocapsopsis crepidinum LEGE 06123]|uniref:Response regulator transcription factor n=1 Tax=Gloeocapsopsis crepidinum LEGE 06123 TaxID=588587 RepID=A0ABR9UT51_9CHRO|nr:LuxR C-terminal-related transcriptional regulator [Gloeocapsopsis crepidinum]MBE9191476.1 response regulator transcription factor [Gloeocapsopsis crepidinum LEGE 06123]